MASASARNRPPRRQESDDGEVRDRIPRPPGLRSRPGRRYGRLGQPQAGRPRFRRRGRRRGGGAVSAPGGPAAPAPGSAGPDERRRLGWVLGLTSTAYFMVALDATVVATSLPRMQADLHVGFTSLQWTLNSYGIAFAAGIITAAALGDRFGRRLIFNFGLVLFTIASGACALAPNASELITARTVQGLGGAIVLPLSLTILTTAFPAERRGTIIGIYGGLAGLAVACGPLVGGAVTQGLSWHWIFWINVPIGVVAVALSLRLLP